MPCDLRAIVEAGRRNDLPVLEDAACAIRSEILRDGEWHKIGRPHGDIACFPFHPCQVVSTGDGGMATIRDTARDAKLTPLRQYNLSMPDIVRHRSTDPTVESYPFLGCNHRMTDIQVAVGRKQLLPRPDGVYQRAVLQALLDAGINSRRGVACSRREPAHAMAAMPHRIDHSEQARDRCILIPVSPGMTSQEQEVVVDEVRDARRSAR